MKYLVAAAAAVMLSWVVVCGLVYGSASDLRSQRQGFDLLTQQALAIEQMRASVLELAASGDEYMMLATLVRMERSQPRDQIRIDFAAKLATARDKFRISFGRFKWLLQGQASGFEAATMAASNPADVEAIRSKYDAYLAASADLHKLAGSHVYLSYVKKVKGEQKSREILLLSELNDRLGELRKAAGTKNPHFESLVLENRDKVLSLTLIAIFPALIIGLLSFRGVVRLFREVSDQKDDIARTNGNLEAALGELRRVQEALVESERLTTLDKLTATVSHELRAPMAAVRNSLLLIRQHVHEPAKMIANLERAQRNVDRCDNTIGDLLEYTRDRSIKLKRIDLSQWLVSLLSEQNIPPDVVLTVDLEARDAVVMIDEDRFRRAVVGLVQNAVEATRSSKRRGEANVRTGVVGSHAFLEVCDNGNGIAPDDLPHIYDPLFSSGTMGAGLALAIAKRLVTQQGGKIIVNSKLGLGTSFQVLLPLAVDRAEKAA